MAATAGAGTVAPENVVAVGYVLGERSPDRAESLLTSPVEGMLQTLPRLTGIRSNTGHAGGGVAVDIELRFTGGAGAPDLAAVLKQLTQYELDGTLAPLAVSVQLRPARFDSPP